MKYRSLADSGVEVSLICLGTMTYGEQNTIAEAHAQLDYAVAQGVNFIDSAEMYPVPPTAATQGATEHHIGQWLARRTDRDRLIIASKVSGPSMQAYLRGGPRLNRGHIEKAITASLKRLHTDYIDLYQVHWPERATNFFGRLGYEYNDCSDEIAIEETLAALARLVEKGQVRWLGISNETAWGTMRYLELAAQHGWPRIVSVQNPYNLLNRIYEIALAEIAHREQVGLLAYSPLAFGVLSGKYLDGKADAKARLMLYQQFDRYSNDQAERAVRRYVTIAHQAGLNAAQMALAYINQKPFTTATIIGATTMEQLQANIASIDIELDASVLSAIEEVHKEIPNPCP